MRLLPMLPSIALLAVGAATVAAQNAPAGAANACVIREISRTPLTVNAREVYIEPTVVLPSRGEILLAGRPNYLFDAGPLTAMRDFRPDSVFGAIVDREGRGRLVPAPIDPARISSTRAIARASGGWAVVFAELHRPPNSGAPDSIARLWYGEYDGTRWGALEELPAAPGHSLNLEVGSELVPHRDSLYLAVRARSATSPNDVLLFARHQGRWSFTIVPTFAAAYVEVLATDTAGVALVVVQADRSLLPDINSMFLYRRNPSWQIVRKLAHGGTEPVFDPRLTTTDVGTMLSWFVEDRTMSAPTDRARAMIGIGGMRDGNTIQLDPDIDQITPVIGFARFPIWVTDHNESPDRSTVRFLTDSAGRARELASIPNPFTGPFAAAALGPSEILVSGPLFHADPARPRLVSLLIRLHVECSRRAP